MKVKNRIRYLRSVKSGITYVKFHNYVKFKGDSCDSLPLEKTMTSHNVIILNKSVFDKDKYKIKNDGNNHYCNIFLEKASYELPKKSVL